MKKESKLCCEKHIDMAFDDFLVENETYPILKKCEDGCCSYCSEKASYILIKSEDNI